VQKTSCALSTSGEFQLAVPNSSFEDRDVEPTVMVDDGLIENNGIAVLERN